MKKVLLPLIILAALGAPSQAFSYGEGADILESERIFHFLINEARSDPQAILKDCPPDHCQEEPSCYKPERALIWNDDMHRAARFHSIFLSDVKCGDHMTMCRLVETLGKDFPEKCNGLPACACEGGKADCDGKAGRTDFQDRGNLFKTDTGASIGGENITRTYEDTPFAFRQLLFEKSCVTGCMDNWDNGHRWSLLKMYNSAGVGVASGKTVIDFAYGGSDENSELSSGAGFIDKGKLWFKTHYCHWTKVDSVRLVLKGDSVPLKRIYGDAENGVYGVEWTEPVEDCTPYYFEAVDEEGKNIRYPTTGSLLYHCDKSWTSKEVNASGKLEGSSDDGCSSAPLSPAGHGMALPLVFLAGLMGLVFGCAVWRRRKNF